MDLMLKDKVAIVTGSTGICKAIAVGLADEGANLAVTYLTDVDKKAAEDSIKKIEDLGCKAIALPLNLTELDEIIKMVDDVVSHYGKIDILVNCAGICTSVLAENVTEEQWNIDTGVDLKGLFFCCKEVFNKSMKKQMSGSIVNVSSVVGVNPIKTNPVYGVAILMLLTRNLSISTAAFSLIIFIFAILPFL